MALPAQQGISVAEDVQDRHSLGVVTMAHFLFAVSVVYIVALLEPFALLQDTNACIEMH